MQKPLTNGCHHIGLTVIDLAASSGFFTDLLGWEIVRQDADYPATFVSDGTILVTLWRAADPSDCRAFDKNKNVGLHHLALQVDSEQALDELHARLAGAGVPIEFGPELLRQGPAKHLMCYEPGGIRVEFIWPGA